MSTCETSWRGGLTCDHLYDNCPNYRRGLPELARYGWDQIGGPSIDPHGTDICGLCLHRHNQTHHKATPNPTQEPNQ